MEKKIKQLLEEEDRRIGQKDEEFGIGIYATCPSGVRDVRIDGLRNMSITELEQLARRKDIDILKVIFDAYNNITRHYIK